MKIGINLPKELVDWLAKRKAETGIPKSHSVAVALRLLQKYLNSNPK